MHNSVCRVGLLATHPIQYYAPWYRALAEQVDLQVFYAHQQTPEGQAEAGFGVAFDWDLPVLEGYTYRFLQNRSRRPNVFSFQGCDTPEIGEIIRREAFDAFVVHGWYVKSYWQAMVACWRTGTPILVRGDSQLSTPRSALKRLFKHFVYRLFIPRFDAYLVVGERARQYYLRYGADPHRMFFTPHTVDNDFFAAQAAALRPERNQLRCTWGIPTDATVFLFAGKFIPVKRPADFVQAVAHASQSHQKVWGLMAGDGPLRGELESRVKREILPVTFTGFLNQMEMPRAYAASDVFVLPSQTETWGLVVNEAMASGLPAIVSNSVGCAPDLIVEGRTGETFPLGNVEQLGEIMHRFVDNPRCVESMGILSLRHIEQYTVSNAVEGTLVALDYVIQA